MKKFALDAIECKPSNSKSGRPFDEFNPHARCFCLFGMGAVGLHAEDFRVGFINTDRIFREANTAKGCANQAWSKSFPSVKKNWLN
jgi:hypothetical protein